MSGIVGHTMYALLGGKEAAKRRLPCAALLLRHLPSYLAGAYLGSDIQVMPEAVCVDTGREVGFGTVPLAKSPLTGGAVRPWTLRHEGQQYRPSQIHEMFYGRSHVVFGWSKAEREHTEAWDHLPYFFADVIDDAAEFFGSDERALAYVLGWLVHVVSDSLIKSVQPGLELHLLDGKYTPRNRPIQDLVTFHEVGVKELQLDWRRLFADLVATPVEPVQFHYMRIAEPRGRLARDYPNAWAPDKRALLQAVLVENRRWCRVHANDVLEQMDLVRTAGGELDCSPAIRQATGLGYTQMKALAENAGFRGALRRMGEMVADMMEATAQRSEHLAHLPRTETADWESQLRSNHQ